MGVGWKRLRGIGAGLALMLATASAAEAAKLEKAECEGLRVEQVTLGEAGINADLARGPEWAKANLGPERLKLIERFIELEEALAFRCPEQPRKPEEVKGSPGKKPAAKTSAAADDATTEQAAEPAASVQQQPARKSKTNRRAKAKKQDPEGIPGVLAAPQ